MSDTLPILTDKERAQNFIRDLVDASEFLRVKYNDRGRSQVLDGDKVTPGSIEVNEISETVGSDTRYGRSMIRRSFSHTFELHLAFQSEVNAEDFKQRLMAVPKLPRDEETGQKQITLLWEDAEYRHPPRDGRGGSNLIFILDAVVERA